MIHQATGVLMQRGGTTIKQAPATLYAQAESSGLDVAAAAAEVVRSVSTED